MNSTKPTRFSIVQALKFAFYTAVEHFFFFFSALFTGVVTFGFVMSMLGFALLYPARERIAAIIAHIGKVETKEMLRMIPDIISSNIAPFIIFMIIGCLLYHFLLVGYIRIGLDIHDRDSSSIGQLFSGWSVFLKAMVVVILYYLLVGVGLLLFVIPGIIVAVTYELALYILIDKNCSIVEAFKESARLTKGTRRHVFALLLILFAITKFFTFASLIAILLWPVPMLARISLYRQLQTTQVQSPIASA